MNRGKHLISLFTVANSLFFILIIIVMLYPLLNVVSLSLSDMSEILRNGVKLIPAKINLSAYKIVFSSSQIVGAFFNSVYMTLFGTSYNLLLTVSYAYALYLLSLRKLPGNRFLFTLVLAAFFFSGGIIPLYMTIKDYGLIDSLWAPILPLGINIWYLIILRSFFRQLPEAVIESACIDGASDLRILVSIILPLSKASLATFTLFYAVERWNEWFYAMMFITNSNNTSLQKMLRDILFNMFSQGDMSSAFKQQIGGYVSGTAVKMAVSVITVVPIICIYPFLQKYFVQGMTLGAVKG